ncbi:MAG: hypothetical protein DRR06_07855 [Gammaproteobacteria bacterium]|nr:MAG: hypothetical protein DRR06_07855 [Gammaproteobacteria bacterium]
MTDQVSSEMRDSESISALMDAEVTELELRRILKSLPDNIELRQKWHRYHLAGFAMRREFPVAAVNLSEQIARAIELEDDFSPVSDSTQKEPGLPQKSGYVVLRKFAIAASVAVVAVFGVQQLQTNFTNSASNSDSASEIATAVQPASDTPEYSAPRVQLPSGFEMPQVSARTVSTGSAQATARQPHHLSSQDFMDKEAHHRQIQSYLHQLMLRHAEQTSLANQQIAAPVVDMQKSPASQ